MAVNGDIRRENGDTDAGLTRIYGDAGREEPSARLDAAILAAARREVGARPRPLAALRAWRMPVGIAAVVVLSVSLVMLVRQEGGDELYRSSRSGLPRLSEPASSPPAKPAVPVEPGAPPAAERARERQSSGRDAPAKRVQDMASGQASDPIAKAHPEPFQGPRGSAGKQPAASPSLAEEAARARESAQGAAVMDSAPSAATAPEAGGPAEARRPVPPAAKAAPSRAMRRERHMPAREDAGPAAGSVASPKSEPRQAADALYSGQATGALPDVQRRVPAILKELDAQPPEKWLERIQALRRDERPADAREVLAEFKRRYPAHPLPAGLE